MTPLDKKLLRKIIDDKLKPRGFRRTASSWLRNDMAAILGVNLQHSMYGKLSFINFFAFYPEISSQAFRSYSKGDFHLDSRGRTALIPRQEQLLLLDGREVDEQEVSREIGKLWFDETLERLLSFADIEKATQFFEKNPDELGFYGEHALISYLQSKNS